MNNAWSVRSLQADIGTDSQPLPAQELYVKVLTS